MEKVEIDKKALLKAYNAANAAGKKLLESLHGTAMFQTTVVDKIKTFEDACKVVGIQPAKVYNKTDSKDEIAYKKLKVIVKALNGTWTPNWNDSNQPKFYPWWNMERGFSLFGVYDNLAVSCVGSRLCYCSREIAEYATKQFIAIYKDYMTV